MDGVEDVDIARRPSAGMRVINPRTTASELSRTRKGGNWCVLAVSLLLAGVVERGPRFRVWLLCRTRIFSGCPCRQSWCPHPCVPTRASCRRSASVSSSVRFSAHTTSGKQRHVRRVRETPCDAVWKCLSLSSITCRALPRYSAHLATSGLGVDVDIAGAPAERTEGGVCASRALQPKRQSFGGLRRSRAEGVGGFMP